jgi:hypothetical protein
MKKTLISFVVIILGLAFGCSQSAETSPRYAHKGPALISNVRIIDGLGNDPIENQDVLITEGRIAAIGDTGSLQAPDGAGSRANWFMSVVALLCGYIG